MKSLSARMGLCIGCGLAGAAIIASVIGWETPAHATRSARSASQGDAPAPNYLPLVLKRDDSRTGIQVQNLDRRQAASLSAAFYQSGAFREQTINLPFTLPGSAASVYVPGSSLLDGAYAAVVTSDREIASIVRTDWPTTRGAAIYSNVTTGIEIVLPLAVRAYYGQSSVITIQNADTHGPADALVHVEFVASGAPSAVVTKDYTIPAGTSITLDLAGDAELAALGDRFLGTMFATSNTPLGVMSFVHNTDVPEAVYGFEGVPAEMASATLYAPLFRAKQLPNPNDPNSGRLDTAMAVVNPGAEPVSVSITYHGAGGSCWGTTVTTDPLAIGGRSNHVFWQGDPAGQGLPDNCYGSAVIRSTGGGVLAIVNDAQNLNQTAAAYNAFTVGQASTSVALPLYRKVHGNGLTTGISVMNASTAPADITLTVVDALADRPGHEGRNCRPQEFRNVGANEVAIFWPGSTNCMPDGGYGSAVIESTQPVVAIVNDVNVSGIVDMATYNGIPAETP